MTDYKRLGLKCGIEIHQQLLTRHKLFCGCSAALQDKGPVFEVKRRLRPVAGEMGDVDAAAAFETLKGRVFTYSVYLNESCSVELDEEPPHPLNPEALDIALQVALMLNCEVPEEIETMRKTVLDGSNTSGFQRTALVGLNGWIETSFGRVGITNVCLEEDACQIIEKKGEGVVYGLNRLGIPLVEIGTTCNIPSPEEAREVAEKIGMILRSTGRVRRGIGSIRQDLNVSISKGARVEIKGVQELRLIPKLIGGEVRRQQGLIAKKNAVARDVRRALPGGSTEFLRPLPGAARMYPETDCPPIQITAKRLREMRKGLPELLSDKEKNIAKRFSLNEEIAGQIVSSGRASLFEKAAKLSDPRLVASVLTRYSGFRIPEEKLLGLFRALGKGSPPREALEEILEALSRGKGVSEVMKLEQEALSEDDVKKIVRNAISKNPQVLKAPRPEQALMGLVMREVRGRAPGSLVMKILIKEIKKKG